MRRIFWIFVGLYLLVGVGFHVGWERAQQKCRHEMEMRGEFVEPPVYSFPISLFFDMTMWPVYMMANYYHRGTIFATPCDKFRGHSTTSALPDNLHLLNK